MNEKTNEVNRLAAYQRVAVLPRGARNIRIEEAPATANRLALKKRHSRRADDPWILNGTFPIEEQEPYAVHFVTSGTSFTYSCTSGLETMSAKGPLLSDLALMVNFLPFNSNVDQFGS